MVKTHKEIIYQYFPDGSGCGLNHFNENKIIRMIEAHLPTTESLRHPQQIGKMEVEVI